MSLALVSGGRLDGHLFVQASAHHPGQLEDAPEVLNASEPFFPLALPSGETVLIAKANVHSAIVERTAVNQDCTLGIQAAVEFVLCDGERLSGALIIDPVLGRCRVLDYLNRAEQRFLPLFSRMSVLLINRALIERVRTVD
ncbi:MAG: hypothetical protein ACT4R6_04635 [Gemmatimonadaceae bacterium]